MKKYLPIGLLFLIAFIVRCYGLSKSPIFPDEITWMVRAKESFLALRTFNWGYIQGFFNGPNAWWRIDNDTQSIATPLALIIGPFIAYLGKGQSILSFNLLPDFVAARLPLVLINSLIIIPLYLLTESLVGRKVAVLTSLLYSLDPVGVAYSRLILNDGLLTFFILVGIYSFFYIKNNLLSVFLSSLSLASGFLTKPNGILLIVAWVTYGLISENKGEVFKKLTLSLIFATIFIQILWPESWYHPVASIFEYLYRQTILVSAGIRVYFAGVVTNNPPPYYYLFQILARLPSYALLGLLAYLVIIVRKFFKKGIDKKFLFSHAVHLSIASFALVFLLSVSFSPKKLGVRYILPVWPILYICASWAIYKLSAKYNLAKIVITFVLLVGVYNLASYYPSYDYYYSELLGGPKNVQKYSLVTHCYGAKESIDYINKCFPQASSFAYLGCARPATPYYYANPVTENWQGEDIVVIEESYRILRAETDAVNYYKDKVPEKALAVKGAVLSRLYLQSSSLTNLCKMNLVQ